MLDEPQERAELICENGHNHTTPGLAALNGDRCMFYGPGHSNRPCNGRLFVVRFREISRHPYGENAKAKEF